MSQLIIAEFHDQFAASSAVNKLLSRGVRRDQVASRFEESLGDTPRAAATPTTVVPATSRDAEGSTKKDGKLAQNRLPQYGLNPERFGHTVVSVAVGDEISAEDIQQWLKAEGAHDLRSASGDLPVADARTHAALDTAESAAAKADVQRAINASRGGAALG